MAKTDSIHLPGTTYLANSDKVRLGLYLDDGLPPMILARFGVGKPMRHPWLEYCVIAEQFRVGMSRLRTAGKIAAGKIWSKRGDCPVEAHLLEHGGVKIVWHDQVFMLSPNEYRVFTDILGAAEQRAKPWVQRRLQKAALMSDPSLLESLARFVNLLFGPLVIIDIFMLLGVVFMPVLFYPFATLTTVLVLWGLVQREHLDRVMKWVRRYTDDAVVADVSWSRLPRRVLDLFVIGFLILLYFICFGGEAAPMIGRFVKKILGID